MLEPKALFFSSFTVLLGIEIPLTHLFLFPLTTPLTQSLEAAPLPDDPSLWTNRSKPGVLPLPSHSFP